jgi:hypothetical protein
MFQTMKSRRRLLSTLSLLFLGTNIPAYAQSQGTTRQILDTTAKPSTFDEPGRYYALVIGINGYTDFNRLQTQKRMLVPPRADPLLTLDDSSAARYYSRA